MASPSAPLGGEIIPQTVKETHQRVTRYPIRQKSAQGQPKPGTSIERRCHACHASFIGLAPGKTGEAGLWHDWRWYCSAECAPEEARPLRDAL